MIHFIFVASLLVIVLLVCGFLLKAYPLVSISAMGMVAVGVYILSTGIKDLNNILTQAIGVIYICLGAYILIRGSVDLME